jgi:hypothetical protein
MATTKISELPTLVNVPGDAQVPLVHAGVTRRASVQSLSPIHLSVLYRRGIVGGDGGSTHPMFFFGHGNGTEFTAPMDGYIQAALWEVLETGPWTAGTIELELQKNSGSGWTSLFKTGAYSADTQDSAVFGPEALSFAAGDQLRSVVNVSPGFATVLNVVAAIGWTLVGRTP